MSARHQFHAHRRDARALHAEHAGGARGHVHDPAADERAAVVDGHDDRTLVVQIGDADLRTEGQRAMRRRQVADMAAARGAALAAVIGRLAGPGRLRRASGENGHSKNKYRLLQHQLLMGRGFPAGRRLLRGGCGQNEACNASFSSNRGRRPLQPIASSRTCTMLTMLCQTGADRWQIYNRTRKTGEMR